MELTKVLSAWSTGCDHSLIFNKLYCTLLIISGDIDFNKTFSSNFSKFTNKVLNYAQLQGYVKFIQVRKQAIEAVRRRGGDVSDETEVLSEYALQFGAFHGQTFHWILENGLGYAAWLVS